jgi:hypothetical protein
MLFYHKIIPNIFCQPVLLFAGNILVNKIISKTYKPQRFMKTSEVQENHRGSGKPQRFRKTSEVQENLRGSGKPQRFKNIAETLVN